MKDETLPSFRQISSKVFALLLFLGFLTRLVLLPTNGFQDDVSLWQNWGKKIVAFGIVHVYEPVWRLPSGAKLGDVNHPPVNLYYLKLISGITNKLPYLHPANNFLIKLPSLVFDALVVVVLLALTRVLGFDPSRGRFVALMYWLNPAIIYHGAFWGLNESVSAFLWLVVLYSVLTKRAEFAIAILFGSIAVKLQNAIYLPIVGLATFYESIAQHVHASVKWSIARVRRAIRGSARVIGGCAAGLAILGLLYLPFILAGTEKQALDVLVHSIGYFPSLTKGAFNAWYLLDAVTHFTVPDSQVVWGIFSFRLIGTILFVIATATNGLLLLRAKCHPQALVCSLVLQGFSFFLLPTEMHERYIFYAIPFLPLLILWQSRWYWLYGMMSILYLSNLVIVYNDYYGELHTSALFRCLIAVVYILCYVVLWREYVRIPRPIPSPDPLA